MKRILLGLILLSFIIAPKAMADGTIAVSYTTEQLKAWENITTVSMQEWLQHALDNKARKSIDKIIERDSDKNYRKMNKAQKKALIKSMNLPKKKKNN